MCRQRRDGDRGAERHRQHRQQAAGPQPVEEGEAQHDQRAGAGADADRRHRRPGRAPVEAVARQQRRIGRMRMAASLADLARRVIVMRMVMRARGRDPGMIAA